MNLNTHEPSNHGYINIDTKGEGSTNTLGKSKPSNIIVAKNISQEPDLADKYEIYGKELLFKGKSIATFDSEIEASDIKYMDGEYIYVQGRIFFDEFELNLDGIEIEKGTEYKTQTCHDESLNQFEILTIGGVSFLGHVRVIGDITQKEGTLIFKANGKIYFRNTELMDSKGVQDKGGGITISEDGQVFFNDYLIDGLNKKTLTSPGTNVISDGIWNLEISNGSLEIVHGGTNNVKVGTIQRLFSIFSRKPKETKPSIKKIKPKAETITRKKQEPADQLFEVASQDHPQTTIPEARTGFTVQEVIPKKLTLEPNKEYTFEGSLSEFNLPSFYVESKYNVNITYRVYNLDGHIRFNLIVGNLNRDSIFLGEERNNGKQSFDGKIAKNHSRTKTGSTDFYIDLDGHIPDKGTYKITIIAK